MKIGKRLQNLRKPTKLSQAQIALELDVSQKAYNKWERDLSLPNILNLLKISEFYDKNLYEVIGIEPKINFYNSEVLVKNMITKNKVIHQETSERLLELYENRIADLEKD